MDIHDGAFLDIKARERAHETIAVREKKLPQDALQSLAEEVIQRLASRFTPPVPDCEVSPSDEALNVFSDALISDDPDAGLAIILDLRKRSVPLKTLYLGYIAGAARRLGDRWERDEVPFTDVTIGAGRLYIIMRALRPTFIDDVKTRTLGREALFASAPGEDHTLGVTMAADICRGRGWHIDLKTGATHDEIVENAARGQYLIIGLSASSRKMIAPLTRLVSSLHVTSPASSIIVSGELTGLEPDLATLINADYVALDAPSALDEMQRLYTAMNAPQH